MPYSPKFYYNSTLRNRSRVLRQKGTLGEVLLWKALQKKQLLGLRFLRQRPIGPFIVDFFCPTLSLIVEIDGVSHVYKENYDQRRQLFLEFRRLTVVRVQELDVRKNIEGVLELIKGTARQLEEQG
jgi:very-short-patch-repair endonuclease